MQEFDLCLLLGTDFPFTDFLPDKPKKVQVDRWASHLGRRTHVDLGLVGHVADTVAAVLPPGPPKTCPPHPDRALTGTDQWRERNGDYAPRGPGAQPQRPP